MDEHNTPSDHTAHTADQSPDQDPVMQVLDDGIDYTPVQQPGVNRQTSARPKHTAGAKQFPAPSPAQTAIDEPRDNPEQRVALSGKQVIQQAMVRLLVLARREVLLVLPTMHELFDDEQMSQGLLDFVRDSPKREVLILINSLADQQASTHQLIKLAQRISSRIQLRQATSLLEPPVMGSDYLVVVDRMHVLRIDDIDKYTGWFDLNYASRAQQYAVSLLQQWPKAREVAEFRQFIL